jgi:hypothetical protein
MFTYNGARKTRSILYNLDISILTASLNNHRQNSSAKEEKRVNTLGPLQDPSPTESKSLEITSDIVRWCEDVEQRAKIGCLKRRTALYWNSKYSGTTVWNLWDDIPTSVNTYIQRGIQTTPFICYF